MISVVIDRSDNVPYLAFNDIEPLELRDRLLHIVPNKRNDHLDCTCNFVVNMVDFAWISRNACSISRNIDNNFAKSCAQ